MSIDYIVRPATNNDGEIVWQMLKHASHQPSIKVVKKQPLLARYGSNWGRYGDRGHVAEQNGCALGMAWLRIWLGKDKGFGYISDDIPELAIAVLPDHRGQGIGTNLLQQTLAMAKDSFPAISLSVRSDNPVLRLYERIGFTKVPGSDVINHAGGVSFNMIYKFNQEADSYEQKNLV